MAWLLNEEDAVKRKFAGLTVTDENAPSSGSLPVAVRFRLPETELANVEFPMIVIDGPAMSKADDREHRGTVRLGYAPEGQPTSVMVPDGKGGMVVWDTQSPDGFDVTLSPYQTEVPIPYNFDYEITVYTRMQSHLSSLMMQLARIDRIPARFGFLEIPQDGTVRTLDLIGGPVIQRDRDENDKRLFRAVYSIRVVSELDPYQAALIENYVDVDGVDLSVIQIDHTLNS